MRPLRLLVVDDSAADAERVAREVRAAGYDVDCCRVGTPKQLEEALSSGATFDAVVSEHDLPGMPFRDTIVRLAAHGLDLPFIIVSGRVTEEAATAALRAGAQDFVPKGRLARLVPALEREIRDAGVRRDRRRIEAELRRSEERFQLAARATNDVLWEYTFETGALWWSDNLPLVLGHDPAEIATLGSWIALLHPADRGRVVESLDAAVADSSESIWSEEYRIRRADGRYARVLDRGYIEQSAGAQPTRMVGSILDLTERLRNELALRESEHRYRTLFETMAQGVVYRSMEGTIIAANPAAEEILGVSEAELTRSTGLDPAWKAYRLDGSPLPDIEHPTMVALRTGQPVHAVIGVRTPRRQGMRWVRVHATPQFRPGEPTPYQVHALFADITEQRRARLALQRSEAYFRSLIEKSADLVAILDESGAIRYASPSYHTVLGLEPGTLIGRSAFELVHPADREPVLATFRSIVEGADPASFRPAEHRLRHADGSWRVVETSGRNRLHDPHLRGVIINSRDITERKSLENRLASAQRLEAIGRLAGGVAHDFNNLLTVMGGAIEVLLDGLAPGSGSRAEAEEVRQAVHRARDLTRQLLAFSRKQILEPRPLDVNRVIHGMEPLLRRLVGADIQLKIAAEARRATVRADETQLQQVVLNLVVNARDALPGGGRIRIETSDGRTGESTGREFIEIRVKDTGTGVDPAIRDHIFEPFSTTKPEGTGLGLATVYGIVSQSGGEVDCSSTRGVGTTFRVRLPVSDEPVEPAPSAGAGPAAGAGERILLVEDDPGVRRFVGRALSLAGYSVVEAGDGKEALGILRESGDAFGLLLTDVIMPGVSGIDVETWARERWPGLATLFMSGYAHAELATRGMTLTEDRVLVKPFEAATVLQRVHETLARARAGAVDTD
jgi:PAS domain S-box-containing protein